MRSRFPSARTQLYILSAVLILIAGWRIAYKSIVLGYSIFPDDMVEVWRLESRISFDAVGKPVTVSLAIPEEGEAMRIHRENVASEGYGYSIDEVAGNRRLIWTRRQAEGPQNLFYQIEVYDVHGSDLVLRAPRPPAPEPVLWEVPYGAAADALINHVSARSSGNESFARQLFKLLYAENPPPEANLLRQYVPGDSTDYDLELMLLAHAGIPARIARGIYLQPGKRWQPLSDLIDVYVGRGWQLFDPRTGTIGVPPNFVLIQRGERSLLEVVGGRNSNLRVSVMEDLRPGRRMIAPRAEALGSYFFDFSVHSLPVEVQNVYKLLSLIPLGILIVVIFRNVIGVRTSGTFMPVLVALALLRTHLITGLVLFILVIAAGLLVRTYLSRMNLLLVPRIAAAVIVVILTMMILSVMSFRLDLGTELDITYFPVIVLAWTIERASITWEEEGPHPALQQIGASLGVAAIIQLIISNGFVQHVLYAYSELNLMVLAAVLLLGTYTGYRLTELRRFEAMVRKP